MRWTGRRTNIRFSDILTPELTEQVEAAIKAHNDAQTDEAKKVKFVDLSEGQYVGKGKYDDQVKGLNKQITDLNAQLKKRDSDLESVTAQLTAAQTDAGKLAEVQKSLTDLQATYTKAQQDWQAQAEQQRFDFALRTAADKMRFSSQAARKDFIREATAAQLKLDGDTILGLTDFTKKYQEADPSAFKPEETAPKPDAPAPAPAPTVVLPAGQGGQKPAGTTFDFHFAGVRPAKQ